MGSAIHNFLEVFYPTDSITTKNFLNYEDKIRDSLNSFYKKHLSENNFNKGKNYLSLKVAEKLLKDFIIYEEELLKENNTSVCKYDTASS